MTWVWDLQDLTQSETLVMLSLADAARDDGVCWPSQAVIAHKARMGLRTVKRVIGRLRTYGLLEVYTRATQNGRRTNVYQLNVGMDFSLQTKQSAKLAPCEKISSEPVDSSPKDSFPVIDEEVSFPHKTSKVPNWHLADCEDEIVSQSATDGTLQSATGGTLLPYKVLNRNIEPPTNQTHQEELPEKQLRGNHGGGLETLERVCDALVACGDASLATSDQASSRAGQAGIAGGEEVPNPTSSPNGNRQTPRKHSVRHLERANGGGVVSGQGNAPESRSERRLEGSGDSGGADWAFLATVLPESWLDWLSGAGVRQLQRLAENACAGSGWTPGGLRDVLASNPLPPPSDVRNPTGFLIARVRDVLAVGKPPSASERRAEVQREKRVFLEDVASKRLALDWEVFKRVNAIAQRGYDDDPDLFDQVRQMADDWYAEQEKRA